MSNDVPPAPAYFPTSPTSALHPPKELYTRLKGLSEEKGELVKVQEFVIPPRSGKAWEVPKGALFRLSTLEGPQVCIQFSYYAKPNSRIRKYCVEDMGTKADIYVQCVGRRPKHLVPGQPTRTLLGRAHATTAIVAYARRRPSMVQSSFYASALRHH